MVTCIIVSYFFFARMHFNNWLKMGKWRWFCFKTTLFNIIIVFVWMREWMNGKRSALHWDLKLYSDDDKNHCCYFCFVVSLVYYRYYTPTEHQYRRIFEMWYAFKTNESCLNITLDQLEEFCFFDVQICVFRNRFGVISLWFVTLSSS